MKIPPDLWARPLRPIVQRDDILLELHPNNRGPDGNPTVSARDLLERCIRSARPTWDTGPSPRWSLVGELTGHGSGYSYALCKALGIDPDETVMPHEPAEWVADALKLHPPEHGNDCREDYVGNCPHCSGIECRDCHEHHQPRGECTECPPAIFDTLRLTD